MKKTRVEQCHTNTYRFVHPSLPSGRSWWHPIITFYLNLHVNLILQRSQYWVGHCCQESAYSSTYRLMLLGCLINDHFLSNTQLYALQHETIRSHNISLKPVRSQLIIMGIWQKCSSVCSVGGSYYRILHAMWFLVWTRCSFPLHPIMYFPPSKYLCDLVLY